MIKKLINYFMHPSKVLIYLASRNIIKMDDAKYLKLQFKVITGKKLNLSNPQTFNEKMQWLKLHDRKEIYTKLVDKYEVKNYIKAIIGDEYLIPTLGVYDSFDEIDFESLPNQFVIKCTHDSGGVVIVKDRDNFDKKKVKKKIEKNLKRNFFYFGREWPYKNVKPRIIIEKYMEDVSKVELKDYKFMCFSGKVKCTFVCSNRSQGLCIDIYDLNWKKMPFQRSYPNSKEEVVKPKNYEKMILLAEKLAKDIPFVRVDFYEINGQIYFGELTFYPGGGTEVFKPEKYNYELGNWIDLNSVR